MRILYLDCFSGISGDMTLAALVDAGADRDYVESELAKIKVEPFSLHWKRVTKNGISSLKLDVITDPGHSPTHHRHYSEIVELIMKAGWSEQATTYCLTIFEKIGQAEAKIHGVSLDDVHFHEVGAIDSIADIAGVALALDSLCPDKIIASPVPLGSGTVRCDHGLYPVPAPATLEMMRGLPIIPTQHRVEMTTPTGAAIIAGLVHEFSPGLPSMIVDHIGYGAGTRDLPNQPNVLRVVLGHVDHFASKWTVPHHHDQLLHDQPLDYQTPHMHGHSHHHDHDHGHHHHHDHAHRHAHHHGHAHEHEGDMHEHTHEHHEHNHSKDEQFPKQHDHIHRHTKENNAQRETCVGAPCSE